MTAIRRLRGGPGAAPDLPLQHHQAGSLVSGCQRAMEERFEGLLRLDAERTATSKQHVNRSGSAGRRASK